MAVKSIYALIGKDAFLQVRKLTEILRELPPDVQRIEFDGERAELAEVFDELRSFALFGGGGKIVVLRNAQEFLTKHRESLEDYAAAPSSSAVFVLRLESLPSNQRIYKAIAKTGEIADCEPPKDVAKWIIEHGKSAHRVTLTPDAARTLADLIGPDFGRLDSELAKLAIESDGKPVGSELISDVVAFQRERQMWDMTGELAAGRPDEALRRWRQLVQLDTSAEFRAVTWLGMWLENVRKALAMKRDGSPPAAICQRLRIWPRDAQAPFLKTAETLGDAGAARAIDLLAEIDQHSKSGVGQAATNVERFILQTALWLGRAAAPGRGKIGMTKPE